MECHSRSPPPAAERANVYIRHTRGDGDKKVCMRLVSLILGVSYYDQPAPQTQSLRPSSHTQDPNIHLKNLKPSPPVNPLVNHCIECGFCESNCPSRDLTLTPRQRIAVWKEIFRLENLELLTDEQKHRWVQLAEERLGGRRGACRWIGILVLHRLPRSLTVHTPCDPRPCTV